MDGRNDQVEIFARTVYEVYDPWTAQIRGLCDSRDDAEKLLKAVLKRKRKTGNMYA